MLQIPEAGFHTLASPHNATLLVNGANSERTLLVHETAGRYRAINASCTHWGCDVDYDAEHR